MKTKQLSYETLMEDYEMCCLSIARASPRKYKVNDDDELKEVACEVAMGLGKMGLLPKGFEIAFSDKLENSAGSTINIPCEDEWISRILINTNQKGTAKIYETVAHELLHSYGVVNETQAELLALEFCASLAIDGNKKYEKAFYEAMETCIKSTIASKALDEGVPEAQKSDVNEIIRARLVGDKTYQITCDCTENCIKDGIREMEPYGAVVYSRLMGAKKLGKDTVNVDGKEIPAHNTIEMLAYMEAV